MVGHGELGLAGGKRLVGEEMEPRILHNTEAR